MTVAILQKSARESRKLPVAIQNGKIATGFKKCHGKKNTGVLWVFWLNGMRLVYSRGVWFAKSNLPLNAILRALGPKVWTEFWGWGQN